MLVFVLPNDFFPTEDGEPDTATRFLADPTKAPVFCTRFFPDTIGVGPGFDIGDQAFTDFVDKTATFDCDLAG